MAFKSEQISRTPYLPDRIAEGIQQQITEGKLAPGARLPTETSLAEMYGVSRNVVREAIARLRNEGIVESRQGVGAFVASKPRLILRLHNVESIGSRARHESLFELRTSLELTSVELAASRRTTADLHEIRRAYEEMAAAMRAGKSESVELDISFHRAIAGATGNPFMLETISFIAEHLKESIEVARSGSDAEEANAVTTAEHFRILGAIERGDPQEAKDAMKAHLMNAASRLGVHL